MSPERFARFAAEFPARRVVVLGDVMLDEYVSGSVERVSPEAPVPVVAAVRTWTAPGGAGNVAANVRSLGLRCDVVGATGEDEAGRTLVRSLGGMGVRCHLAPDPSRETTVKTRVLARGQQIVRIDRERRGDVSAEIERGLRATLERLLADADALILADYNKGVLSAGAIRASLALARDRGVFALADPKRRNFHCFGGATVLKPNRAEIEAALGEAARPLDAEWMETARSRLGCDHLLLTLGPEGMALASPGGRLERALPPPRGVFDVTGAGDTVAAAVAAMAAVGCDLGDAVRVAAHAASRAVAKIGAAAVTAAEIEASLARDPATGSDEGALECADSRSRVAEARAP